MIPMKTSSIFKSRWMALVWAAGIIWFAYDFASPDDASAGNNASATDITGAPISKDDEKAVQEALNSL